MKCREILQIRAGKHRIFHIVILKGVIIRRIRQNFQRRNGDLNGFFHIIRGNLNLIRVDADAQAAAVCKDCSIRCERNVNIGFEQLLSLLIRSRIRVVIFIRNQFVRSLHRAHQCLRIYGYGAIVLHNHTGRSLLLLCLGQLPVPIDMLSHDNSCRQSDDNNISPNFFALFLVYRRQFVHCSLSLFTD